MPITLREYQQDALNKARMILYEKGCVYIAGQPRVGKTPTSIMLAKVSGWKKFCIITSKKAIPGIKKFTAMEPTLDINVTNFARIHELMNWYDGYIIDEAHEIGAFPKPSKRAILLKSLVGNKPIILMSGTPTPESPSQIFHQFYITRNGPFKNFKNFYAFAKEMVDVKQQWRNGQYFNDYRTGKKDVIDPYVKPYTIAVSQQDAGFTSFVEEKIAWIKIDPRIYKLIKIIRTKKVYTFLSGKTIVADTPVRMQSIIHQISSGTIKFEDDSREVLDDSKAKYIKENFAGKKIAIYYQFIAEAQVLQKYFPFNTDDPELFNSKNHFTFLSQMKAGRQGVDLSTADCLIAYNIDFSATTYWQFRERMQSLERKKESVLWWIFSERGLEKYVHKTVSKKLNFTSRFFEEAINEMDEQMELPL